MRRQIRQLALGPLLLFAACTKGAAVADSAALPYSLDAARDGDELAVALTTHDGFHVNADYPVSFKMEDGARVDLKDTMQKKPCASGAESCSASMRVPNKNGTLAFSVCSADLCRIEKLPLASRWKPRLARHPYARNSWASSSGRSTNGGGFGGCPSAQNKRLFFSSRPSSNTIELRVP